MNKGNATSAVAQSAAPNDSRTASPPADGFTQQLLDSLGAAAAPLRPVALSPSPPPAPSGRKRPRGAPAAPLAQPNAAEGGGGEERRRRREELMEIPLAALALYTRLAECGVETAERAFATVVVRRAQEAVDSWEEGFEPES